MYKITETYGDYFGNERTEDFYFNLNKAEVLEMETSIHGGYHEMLTKIIAAQDMPTIMKNFKELVLKSYGKISSDGRRFEKSEKDAIEFSQTEAYSNIYMRLATNTNAAIEFVNGIMPKNMGNETNK